MGLELCTQRLIDASNATENKFVLATRRNGRWDLVEQHEVTGLVLSGEEPVKGYVDEDKDGYKVFVSVE